MAVKLVASVEVCCEHRMAVSGARCGARQSVHIGELTDLDRATEAGLRDIRLFGWRVGEPGKPDLCATHAPYVERKQD